ncbi:MAG TPA: alpha-ketoacid dehydrogenase subunit beta [Chloroflexota bacterium]|jgi:2-oxoisovalerate dehydrogenase E1 component beta subunit|nr:alpha-ketoacid dehydrogenase subunit beta [Chloroflexota bacterium]
MSMKNVLQAVHDALDEEMARDERVILLGQDVGVRGGVFRASDGLLARYGERRVIDTPLSESAIIGVAIGASIGGYRPVAEIQFADFIWPAMDQIVSEAARMRYRSHGTWGCPLVIRTPYGAGIHGGLYHSQSIEATFAHVPGIKVVAPATPRDAKGLLKSAIRDPDPVLFLEHKRTYRLIREEVPDEDYTIPLGKAIVRRPGRDLTILTYGMMVHESLKAAEAVAADGIEVEVVDLRTLSPLDKPAILESVERTHKVVIVHEDSLTGGFGGEIAAIIASEAFDTLDGPIMRVAAPDAPAAPFNDRLEEAYLPSAPKIEQAIRQLAAY